MNWAADAGGVNGINDWYSVSCRLLLASGYSSNGIPFFAGLLKYCRSGFRDLSTTSNAQGLADRRVGRRELRISGANYA